MVADCRCSDGESNQDESPRLRLSQAAALCSFEPECTVSVPASRRDVHGQCTRGMLLRLEEYCFGYHCVVYKVLRVVLLCVQR